MRGSGSLVTAADAAGRERVIGLWAVPILVLVAAGAIMGGLRAEIGQRRRVEEELRKSETRWRTAIDRLPVGLWAMDREGRYIMANPRVSARGGE